MSAWMRVAPWCALSLACSAYAEGLQMPPQDPRIQSVIYSPSQVIEVPVRSGVVTNITLPDDDAISVSPATGVGADCSKDTDTWCLAATQRDIFVKPKTGATRNNVVVIGERRRYAFELVVDSRTPRAHALSRMNVVVAPPPAPKVVAKPPEPTGPTPADLVSNRMRFEPHVRNANYSVAVGEQSEDLVPTVVFDDGNKTYFSFPANRPLPAVFQTLPDGSEEMVNVTLDPKRDLLSADRVARRFVLRLGNGVVAVLNEAFELEGQPPVDGTTVPGVRRLVVAGSAAAPKADSPTSSEAKP